MVGMAQQGMPRNVAFQKFAITWVDRQALISRTSKVPKVGMNGMRCHGLLRADCLVNRRGRFRRSSKAKNETPCHNVTRTKKLSSIAGNDRC
jgi:hypothetical protein